MKEKTLILALVFPVLSLAPVVGAQQGPARTELTDLAGQKAVESVLVPQAVPGRPAPAPAALTAADCVLAAFPQGDPMRHGAPEIFEWVEKGRTRAEVIEHMREYEEKIMGSIDVKDFIRRAREETGVTEKQVSDRELAKRFQKAIPAAAAQMARTETDEFYMRGVPILKGCGLDPDSKPFFARP